MEDQSANAASAKSEQQQLWHDLAITEPMVAKSVEIHAWFMALVESGFSELPPPLMMTGHIIRWEP